MRRLTAALLMAFLLSGCAMHGPGRPQVDRDDSTGADVANAWYVPGRAIICATGGFISGVVMLLTLGQSYEEASQLMHGACSGPWTLGANDMRSPAP